MSRRRLVAIASAGVLFGIGLLVALAVVSVTQTDYGRERVRQFLQAQVTSRMSGRGTMYIGRMSGGLLTGVTIDSFAIRDDEDSLVVSTGRVRIEYDPRDLLDRRLLVRTLEIERPFVNLRRHADRVWNYRRIFPKGERRVRSAERRFGDYIVIDSAILKDGTVIVTMPWAPDDSLSGARRDSAISSALADTDRFIRVTSEGHKRSWRWTKLNATLAHARIADPDSIGRLFRIADLDVDEFDPPFAFRNVRGPVRMLGDTVWFELTHWDLPASTGSARGKVMWGFEGPVRYDVHVKGDSVSLADVNWVYPTLPTTGGGRMELAIRNQPDPEILDYALTEIDVRSMGSHLRGAMTFGVGGPVLIVKDVALTAEPVDFKLLETLSGDPFPVPWAGQISGTVRARGGPLDRFWVDDARFIWRDAHVRDAVTRGRARGGLDILEPAYTIFRGFDVDVETLDLRSIEYLFPKFPRLGGTVAGVARLDSSWLDVRFSEADITHHDGPHAPSRFTGSGRVTLGDEFLTFDLDVVAQPVSFTTLARSYPALPLRGPYSGPMRVRGTVEDLDFATSLAGPAGALSVDGHFDLFAPGFAMAAQGRLENLDVRQLLAGSTLPTTRLNVSYRGDLRGDSLANLVGALALDADRSRFDSLRVFPSLARLRFDAGRLALDTLYLETTAASVSAKGALGLVPGVSDTLRYWVLVDSLGGLRPYLGTPRAPRAPGLLASADAGHVNGSGDGNGVGAPASAPHDSLAGTIRLDGAVTGSVDALGSAGSLRGRNLYFDGLAAESVTGAFALLDVTGAPRGDASVRLETVTGAGVRVNDLTVRVHLADSAHGRIAVEVNSDTGPRGLASLGFARDSSATRLSVDTVTARLGERTWSLVSPAMIVLQPSGIAVDSIVVGNGIGGTVALRGALPQREPVNVVLRVDSLPLADVGILAQARSQLGGVLDLNLLVSGTREQPTINASASVNDGRFGQLRFPFFTARGTYDDQRLNAAVQVFRNGQAVMELTGVLPVNVALVPAAARLLDDSLQGAVRADRVDLAVLEPLTPELQQVAGTLSTDVQIGGTWRRPTLSGQIAVANAEAGLPTLGIRLRQVNAEVLFSRDRIDIRRLSAVSGEERGASASLTGSVLLDNFTQPRFDLTLRAHNFQAVRTRRVADIELSGQLQLRGPVGGPALEGALTVERGALYLPERARKQLVDLSDPEFYDVVDTTLTANRQFLPRPPTQLVRNLEVHDVRIGIGNDVWLRSAEANVKLGGEVGVTREGDRLALAGTVEANRGTYRLDLGLVQRTFEVTNGRITFFGDPERDAALDITAVHTVRQANRGQDVRIRATIGGTLTQPRLTLSSDERIALSETEILSYLVFGAPSFVVAEDNGRNVSSLRPVASALLPTLGSAIERALADQIGIFDLFQIQTGAAGESNLLSRQTGWNVLSGSRIGVGKQLSHRTFISANAGLCTLAPGTSGRDQRFGETVGVSIEHRLNYGFSLQAGVEPGTSALLCGQRSQLTPTPRQLGFDLFREWSF